MALGSKLTFRQVCFRYGDRPILERFNLDVRRGEFVSVIGPSGVGKSTIFQLASGLLQPTEGTILLDGNAAANRLGKVGYMPQKDLLMPWRTIVDNAALPLEIQGVPRKAARMQVRAKLPEFGLDGFADAYPDQLSGGMRQRVSLLRATLTGTDLLLLDEPFSALDGITRMEMQDWLLSLWQSIGLTVIMITHDIEEAILLADRVLVLAGSPIREAAEVTVPFARTERVRLRHDPAMSALRQRVWNLLKHPEGVPDAKGRHA